MALNASMVFLKQIYAAGWEGEIWHYDGNRWSSICSPTNIILNDICCAGDGNVYAGGRVGMLIVCRRDHWKVIDHDSMTEGVRQVG